MASSPPPSALWPARWERGALWLLLVVVVGFGVFVEVRSVFLKRRMGDLGVFLRAAWAARQGGAELYTISCDNHWHYCYPATLAILLIPLADPPPGADPAIHLPYAVSVAVWYVFSLLCLAIALQVLASALEQTSTDPAVREQPAGTRRWWALRLFPLLACLPQIGGSLVRGQVTLLLLALLCAFIAALIRGRRLTAGLWLAAAICLKIIPVFLLIVPLKRRDGRCLAGCALGLVLGLIVLPVAVFGPARTVTAHRELCEVLVAPSLGVGSDQSRVQELLGVTATDSQSFFVVLHNTLHPNRLTRPREASHGVHLAHWGLSAAMLLLLLTAFRRPPRSAAVSRTTTLLAGALILNMILASPVCHLHYFALAVPLVMGLVVERVHRSGWPGWGLTLLMGAYLVGTAVPSLPWLRPLRDCGLAMYAALLLAGAACVSVLRGGASSEMTEESQLHWAA
jgi:alpha-1,2-mannosyltransferase